MTVADSEKKNGKERNITSEEVSYTLRDAVPQQVYNWQGSRPSQYVVQVITSYFLYNTQGRHDMMSIFLDNSFLISAGRKEQYIFSGKKSLAVGLGCTFLPVPRASYIFL